MIVAMTLVPFKKTLRFCSPPILPSYHAILTQMMLCPMKTTIFASKSVWAISSMLTRLISLKWPGHSQANLCLGLTHEHQNPLILHAKDAGTLEEEAIGSIIE